MMLNFFHSIFFFYILVISCIFLVIETCTYIICFILKQTFTVPPWLLMGICICTGKSYEREKLYAFLYTWHVLLLCFITLFAYICELDLFLFLSWGSFISELSLFLFLNCFFLISELGLFLFLNCFFSSLSWDCLYL